MAWTPPITLRKVEMCGVRVSSSTAVVGQRFQQFGLLDDSNPVLDDDEEDFERLRRQRHECLVTATNLPYDANGNVIDARSRP